MGCWSFLLMALLLAKDPAPFPSRPAASYAARDAHDGVTIAAEPYDTSEKIKDAFGKYDPMKIGIMPFLFVVTNSTQDAVRLDNLKIEFIAADRQHAEPIPAGTVSVWVKGKKLPSERRRSPLPIPLPQHADPEAIAAIVNHEFVLKMIPPGDSVSGYLYFDTSRRRDVLRDAHLYITGLTWAKTGKELLYFEISFDDYLKSKPSR